MKKLAYITHPIYLEHNAGPAHPERAQRLIAINDHIHSIDIADDIDFIKPDVASEDQIGLVHDKDYINEVKFAYPNGQRILDIGDTVVSEKSFEAGLYAAGAVIKGIDILKNNKLDRVFCAVRPPGHHAEQGYARGFCLFNNVAIAARYAQQCGLAQNILIVDWDVHHGNGTQHTFERDDSVFYYSLHQYPFFPGSGAVDEVGLDKGKGYTLNRPLPAYTGNEVYLDIFKSDMKYIQNKFNADLIIISAGFDAHKDEPLASQLLDETAYYVFSSMVREISEKYCDGKILSVFEGGYNLEALKKCVEIHLNILIQ